MVEFRAEFRVSNKFRFPCENKKKLPSFIDYNPDVADVILLYGKKNMGDLKCLEVMFLYFHYEIIPNLLLGVPAQYKLNFQKYRLFVRLKLYHLKKHRIDRHR